MQTTAALLTITLALAGPPASRPSDSSVEKLKLSNCIVSLIEQAQMPAKQAGVLKSLNVREGDEVKTGDLLAQIDDRDANLRSNIAQHDYEAARLQATNNVRVKAADASAKVAEAELSVSQEINRSSPGAISKAELMKLDLARVHAVLQVSLAKFEYKIAGITSLSQKAQSHLASNDQLDRSIKAPWDGVIVKRFRYANEWVQQGEPILRMVRLDRLRIEGFVRLADYSPQEVIGSDVTINVKLSRGKTIPLQSKIIYASERIEGEEYRVWAEIKNLRVKDQLGKPHWLIRPGMGANMTISIPRLEQYK